VGIIADGVHVHPASLRVAVKAKPRGKVMLVTDAMPPVGSENKSYQLNGETVSDVDGVIRNGAGALAGSALDMATAVRNAVRWLGVDLAEAARMASRTRRSACAWMIATAASSPAIAPTWCCSMRICVCAIPGLAAPPHERCRHAIAAFRIGRCAARLTVAAMLLVNDPGDWGHVYAPLLHSEWIGCTPTDLVFPFSCSSSACRSRWASRRAWNRVPTCAASATRCWCARCESSASACC
jgi:hypothetical protein